MKNFTKNLIGLLLYFFLIFVCVYLFSHYVTGGSIVDGPSMNDTLQDGDRLVLNKFTYRVMDLDRFDIIVFKYAYDTDTYYVKRIIGLPGESVRIDEQGQIWINDELLEENYGKETMEDPGIAAEPVNLRAGEYFVLGDNRNNSIDSRSPDVGIVRKSQILGSAWLRLYPHIKLLH